MYLYCRVSLGDAGGPPIWLNSDHYMPYVGADRAPVGSTPDHVNQFVHGPKWLNILSRFAHDVMKFNPKSNHLREPGTHDTGHLPPTGAAAALKNEVTYQISRAIIGVSFHRVSEWMTMDAEKLVQYPNQVPDIKNWTIWQEGEIPVPEGIPIPNLGDLMAILCGDQVKKVGGLCVGAWVYQLNARIGESSYHTNLKFGGEIRLPDMTRHTWYPHLYLHRVTGTGSQRSDQWDEIIGWFRDAHDHYLASVAPAIEHT